MFKLPEMADNGRCRPSAQEMDDCRTNNIAYQYLCHLEEAKVWMEAVLKRQLPLASELEDNLRNGVVLARLGNFVSPEVVPLGSIYDPDQKRYEKLGLNFRHTDNINSWIRALQHSGFPKIFLPEVPDVFDKKNMPKVIYCIHALSAHLFRLGVAPAMQDLYGKIQFTDDDITNVGKELKESGVVMPAFQKIGGLFTQNKGKSLEAAIFAVNDALSQGNIDDLYAALSDPLLQMAHVKKSNLCDYFAVLSTAKNEKMEASFNKSLDGSYESDAVDDILSVPEIQGHVHAVNLQSFWSNLIDCKNDNQIEKNLNDNWEILGDGYQKENMKNYVMVIESLALAPMPLDKVRQAITQIIRTGNNRADEEKQETEFIKQIRKILEEGTAQDLLNKLKQSNCYDVKDFAATLYFDELQQHVNMSGKLNRAHILSCIRGLNLVAGVSAATDTGNCDLLYDALSALDNHLHQILDIRSNQRMHYLQELDGIRSEKLGTNFELLTIDEIQDCIAAANDIGDCQNTQLDLLQNVVKAVENQDTCALAIWLKKLVPDAIEDHADLYGAVLRAKRKELWLDDVLGIVEESRNFLASIQARATFLCTVRKAVEAKDDNQLQKLFSNENGSEILETLSQLFNQREKSLLSRENVDGLIVYIDTCNGEFQFQCAAGSRNSDFGVSTEDIDIALSKLKMKKLKNAVKQTQAVIKIQSALRGYLVRKMIQNWNNAALTIQKWWKNKRQLLQGADGERFMDYYLNNMDQIKAIQGCLINRQKRKAESEIASEPSCKNQTIESVSSADAVEELIQKLRQEVVESIKKNQDLSKKLQEMDTKIGLLVRNRISIAAIMAENRNQKQNKSAGLKSLCKEAKTLLDGYQKLFYLLQTRPEYLSRIMTQSSNLTIQNSIMNLFNMGSSARDAYLLLRLFATALRQEVEEKFQKPSDAATVFPLVLKMAVSYARQTGGQHRLQPLLAPLIYRVLEENETLDTNPVDIYRRWLNESEVKSGCASKLPRNVTQDEALNHTEVVERLQRNIHRLKIWVKEFLTCLAGNTHRFPYALKFIAKSLSEALREKFPEATEKEILKVIGHLIYYRYVNSAIVAPDAFHIISLPAQQPLRPDQRKNLASIAKMLQFSASKNGFGEESKHLMGLNPFIIECHEIMKNICRDCCNVEPLEKHFHVSQYSEAVLLRRPRVYMTVTELCECHQMLIKLRHTVAPDYSDPIHEVLEDLKEVPTPAALLGCSLEIAANVQFEKSLICLELDHEFFAEPKNDKQVDEKIEQRREGQNKELSDLNLTLARLQEKTKHFEEQIVYYDKYLEKCLSNFTLKKKKKKTKKIVVKYTAEQLKKKGVLTNLDSVPQEQQHNVEFEIASGDVIGRFRVKCRFMGVEVDTTDIDIQELLSLQFEGCGVMNIFGQAQVNVNLLIFLLNKKFTSIKDGKHA